MRHDTIAAFLELAGRELAAEIRAGVAERAAELAAAGRPAFDG